MHPANISIARVSENSVFMHLELWTMPLSNNTRLASTMDRTRSIMVEDDGDHQVYVDPKGAPTSGTQQDQFTVPTFLWSRVGPVGDSQMKHENPLEPDKLVTPKQQS